MTSLNDETCCDTGERNNQHALHVLSCRITENGHFGGRRFKVLGSDDARPQTRAQTLCLHLLRVSKFMDKSTERASTFLYSLRNTDVDELLIEHIMSKTNITQSSYFTDYHTHVTFILDQTFRIKAIPCMIRRLIDKRNFLFKITLNQTI